MWLWIYWHWRCVSHTSFPSVLFNLPRLYFWDLQKPLIYASPPVCLCALSLPRFSPPRLLVCVCVQWRVCTPSVWAWFPYLWVKVVFTPSKLLLPHYTTHHYCCHHTNDSHQNLQPAFANWALLFVTHVDPFLISVFELDSHPRSTFIYKSRLMIPLPVRFSKAFVLRSCSQGSVLFLFMGTFRSYR